MKNAIRLAALALVAMPFAAFAADITTNAVECSTGTLSASGNNWTASALYYKASSGNDSVNRSVVGWYAGIKRTWALSSTGSGIGKKYTGTKPSSVKASMSDNAGRAIAEYNVYNSLGTTEQSPAGSGIKNATQLGGLTALYMKTTEWNVWVTPEIMKTVSEKGEDYVATLTMTDGSVSETYTITIPRTVELVDNNGAKWWPEQHSGPVSIEDAEITLSATEIITRGETVGVAVSQVTVDKRPLTEGTDYSVDESSVLQAAQVGEYTIKLNGIGSYTGSATATWKIIEPQGAFADDAMSIRTGDPAYGCIDPENLRRLNITNTVALVYRNDDGGERWEAAVEIRWPHRETAFETYIFSQVATKVQYTDAQHAAVKVGEEDVAYGDEILAGEWAGLSATEGSATYYKINGILISSVSYDYFDKLVWTVSITPADLQAAIESGAKHLEYSIVCGSVSWGDETEGDVLGIADTEFSVSMSLAKVFLLDGEGHQVFPAHEHKWDVAQSEDGTTLVAKCVADGCYLAETTGELRLTIVPKDSTVPAYAEGHYRDGVPAEALLKGIDAFYPTGAAIGDIRYFDEGGGELASAPVEPGRYYAIAEVSIGKDVWSLRADGLEILAGEASMDGVHVKDASEYLERATGDSMQIAAGKSYTASKSYQIPAKYGVLNLTCGVKTYDLAGFTVTAAADKPLFENNGSLVIKDSSEGSTGTIAANQASTEDVIIVNTGTLTIEGGTFRGSIVNDGGTVSITGGKFSVKPDATFVADGYDLVRRGKLWSVEKHEHDYRLVVVGGRLAIVTCCNVFADDSLQVSHCGCRQLVGILGIRKSFTGLTKGVPALSVDYDRKEHPAEFYAINMTMLNTVVTDSRLLGIIRDVVDNVDFANLAETDVVSLLSVLSQSEGFFDVLSNILGIYVEADAFEKLTGYKLGNVEYAVDGEAFEGVPCEAGDYTATMSITLPDGNEKTVKGSFRINEKELPIETDGHPTHFWSFSASGAKVTATCPGNLGALKWIDCNASPMAIELVPSVEGGRKVYDAQPLEVVVSNLSAFVINTETTVSDVEYYDANDVKLDKAPTEPGEYTAKVVVEKDRLLADGVYTATLPLTIDEKKPEGEFFEKGWTRHVGAGCSLLSVVDGAFYYPVELPWPYQIEQVLLTPMFTDPEHAEIRISTVRRTFSGQQLLDGEGEEWGLAADAGEFFRVKKFKNQSYMKGVTWLVPFTFDEVDAARAAGETEIVRSITLEGKCWEDDMIGLKPTTYTVILDIANLVVTDDEGRQIYPVHHHEWTPENTGGTLSLVCGAADCPQAPGLVAELTVPSDGKTYDGVPVEATLSGTEAMRIHASVDFGEIAYIELGEDGAEYPLGSVAPSLPGRYRAEVEYSDRNDIVGVLTVEFEIKTVEVDGLHVYFDDPRPVRVYTGEEQGLGFVSVWYGPFRLVYGRDFTVEGTMCATDVGEYTFAVVGAGKFSGRLEYKWRIVEPTRPFAPDALKIPAGPCIPKWGEIGEDGASVVVVDSENLVYNDATGEWSAPLVIDWPALVEPACVPLPPCYTDPAHAKVETDAGKAYIVSAFFRRPLSPCPEEYVLKVLWVPSFTLDDIKSAADAGKDELVFEITVGSTAWRNDPFGLKSTTYRLVVPIKGFVVDDDPEDPVVVDWYWLEYLGNGATSGEMPIERRLTIDRKRLSDCAFKNTGYNLLGWSTNENARTLAAVDFADRQFVSDEFELGVTNKLYAVWTTNMVVSGDIEGDEYESISKAVIWGVGSTEEDAVEGRVFGRQAPWRYVFEVPARGAYDISIQAELPDGKATTTTMLVIAKPDPDVGRKADQSVVDPGGDWSSTLDMADSGSYPAVVGGVDNIARQSATPSEKDRADSVEVRFIVTEMPRSDTTPGYTRILNDPDIKPGCVLPLDFTLAKFVNGVFREKLHDLTAFDKGVVKLVMAFSMDGRRNFRVVRYHEETDGDPSTGSVYVLPDGEAAKNDDGEFFEFDGGANELLISGAKLSTYALVWDGAIVDQRSFVWNVDWLSGMYVPSIELEVKDGNGWASLVGNMYFMLEKRDFAKLWDGRRNQEVSDTETIDGKEFYKVKLSDKFDNDGPDSDMWGAAWYDAQWINAALSDILLYAPSYWPTNPKDVPDLDNLVAYVVYESYGCKGSVKVGANASLISALSVSPLKTAKPQSMASLNKSLAFGAPVSEDAEPYCRIASFSFADGFVSGRVEVGAGSAKGAVGSNVTVILLGAKTLDGGFSEIARVACSDDGSFVSAVPEGYSFFKVEVAVRDVVR